MRRRMRVFPREGKLKDIMLVNVERARVTGGEGDAKHAQEMILNSIRRRFKFATLQRIGCKGLTWHTIWRLVIAAWSCAGR